MIGSVFTNSCIKVPVDPISKMPKTAYERVNSTLLDQQSIDSPTTCSASTADVDVERVKDFYQSIPDYNDINHLSSTEFYSTLKFLREKKRAVLGIPADYVTTYDIEDNNTNKGDNVSAEKSNTTLNIKPNKVTRRRKSIGTKGKEIDDLNMNLSKQTEKVVNNKTEIRQPGSCLKINQARNNDVTSKELSKGRLNRNHSACSISWHDDKVERDKSDIDKKFDKFFQVKNNQYSYDDFKTQSMPSSPLRTKSFGAISCKSKNFTIPKPFKMTERDDDERVANELRTLQRSFSEDMLNQKRDRNKFRARPVPIESRIPLYDKILEDQAMRRAITKINSEAELRAQMKPFSFTKREENAIVGVCDRAVHVLPKPKKKKRFRARPIPKNLFSNYFYDKMKQDEFFRSMNRRIRAEEMLRNASYPGNMATRDRSRLSTPGAHSDLPIDPSPAAPSTSSSDRNRCSSPIKGCKTTKGDFITTSSKPFRFKTESRANQKMLDMVQKIYQSDKHDSISDGIAKPRPYTALELKGAASGRSNLAAVLRAETVRRKFDLEAATNLAEQRRRLELQQRDRQLRSKPAWHLVRNNHEEDIAMRLQTRRDEERMRREEFLHEMELMYGRVQQQPLLFERYYAPRSYSPSDSVRFSPRKCSGKKRTGRRNRSFQVTTPSDGFESDVLKCMDKIEKNHKTFDNSDDVIDRSDL